MPTPWPFLVPAMITSVLAIWGKTSGRLPIHWVAKPLTVVLILAAAIVMPSRLASAPLAWLYAALALSLAGDVFLMFKDRFFVLGLLAFLLAHVAYLICFTLDLPWRWLDLVYLVPPLAFALWVLRILWPSLGKLRPAVVAYVVALTLVAWRLGAYVRLAGQLGTGQVLLATVGGALFVLADSLLALRFFQKRGAPYGIELGAYFAAQACIVASTWA